MRAKLAILTVASVLAGALGSVSAQTAAPAAKSFASSSDIAALVAKARHDLKPGDPAIFEPIVVLAPYTVNLEYRVAPAPAAVHEKDAELIHVIEGRGTFVIGGKLVDEKRHDATNLAGSAITGGSPRTIAKGDFIFVPENTPHQFTSTGGGTLVLMTLHIPRPVGN